MLVTALGQGLLEGGRGDGVAGLAGGCLTENHANHVAVLVEDGTTGLPC